MGTTMELHKHPHGTLLWLSAVQWFVFMVASSITVPIVLGHAFGMNPEQTSLYTGQTLLACGVIGIVQAFLGHRYAILEGPSGLWWSVFLILISTTAQVGGSIVLLQRELEFGLIASGAVLVLMAVFKVIDKIHSLFTPLVTGTYLILLALQLSKSLVAGALGIGYNGSTHVIPKIALLSIVLIVMTLLLTVKGKGFLKSLVILIGLVLGWVLFAIFGLVQFPSYSTPLLTLPRLLPFGPPKFQLGIVLTSVITVVVLLSNLIASIQAFASVVDENPKADTFSKGTLITGLGTVLSGVLGVVGNVPISGSASFISITKVASRLPFILASAGLILLGLIPRVGDWAATLPAPVGFAVLLVVFVEMLGIGLRALRQGLQKDTDLMSAGLAILIGIGIEFIPASAWSSLPSTLVYLLNNGLIVGVVLVLLLQHVFFRSRV